MELFCKVGYSSYGLLEKGLLEIFLWRKGKIRWSLESKLRVVLFLFLEISVYFNFFWGEVIIFNGVGDKYFFKLFLDFL